MIESVNNPLHAIFLCYFCERLTLSREKQEPDTTARHILTLYSLRHRADIWDKLVQFRDLPGCKGYSQRRTRNKRGFFFAGQNKKKNKNNVKRAN